MVVALTKVALSLLYLAVIGAFFFPPLSDYLGHLLIVTTAIFAIHLVEYFLVKRRMREIAGNRLLDLPGVLLFGFAHWWPMIRGADGVQVSGCK